MKPKDIFRKIYFAIRRAATFWIPKKLKTDDFRFVDIKSILVIRIDRIGDLISSLPAIKALRQAFPSAKISVLVSKNNDKLLLNIPWIDTVISYQGFIKTAVLFKQGQFDLAIDLLMDYPLKTALLAYLSKAEFVAGFDIEARGRFFNFKLKPAREKKHVSQYMLDLVRMIAKSYSGVDIPYDSIYPRIPVLEQNNYYINSLLKENGVEEGNILVGIHPGGHFVSQCWPIDKFAQLADSIIERYKVKVFIVGSSQENGLVDKMISSMKNKAIKVIGLSLDKLLSLISAADLFICNNSGPLHLACALGIPTVSTMGPTDSSLWWPLGENHIVVKKDLPCSPCSKAICKRHDCMDLITLEDMIQAVQVQIDRIKSKINGVKTN